MFCYQNIIKIMLFNNLSFRGYMQILSYTIYGIKNKKQIPSLVSKEKVPQSPLIVIVLLSSIKKKRYPSCFNNNGFWIHSFHSHGVKIFQFHPNACCNSSLRFV